MEQLDLLRFIVGALEELGIAYMVVGSYASGAYGEPRFTQDIDVVVELTTEQLDGLLARLPADEFYVSREAAVAAIQSAGQFNVIHPESGVKIDFMIPGSDAWARQELSGRVRLELLSGVEAYAARPEDVIIAKLGYYREGGSEKHLRDIAGMLKVSGASIDRAYVEKWAADFGLTQEWQAVLKRIA